MLPEARARGDGRGGQHAIEAYLARARVPFDCRRHRRALGAQDLAHALGLRRHEVVKTILVESRGARWMVALTAALVVDFGRLAATLGEAAVRMMREAEFACLFPECEVGAGAPLGRLYGLPMVMDQALGAEPELTFRAGNHENAITVRRADFERLESPLVGSFARPPTLYDGARAPGAWTP